MKTTRRGLLAAFASALPAGFALAAAKPQAALVPAAPLLEPKPATADVHGPHVPAPYVLGPRPCYAMYQPALSHSHSIMDPGHSHGMADPTHNHSIGYPSGWAIPGSLVAFADASKLPIGWVVCDGTKGTPDLRGMYITPSQFRPGGIQA